MGLKDQFKNFMGVNDVEDDDFVTEEDIREAGQSFERSSYSSGRGARRESNIMSMAAAGSMKLVVIEPKSFEEAPKLVDSLKERKPVIINLESLDQEVARKIFDFLSGATYALNGNIQKIANNIFVFAPDNVDISADDRDSDFELRSL